MNMLDWSQSKRNCEVTNTYIRMEEWKCRVSRMTVVSRMAKTTKSE